MMTLEVALVMTVGGIAGSILVSQMWQMNWFKRENFKFKQSMDRKENSIRFRTLERDLKIKEGPSIPPREKGTVEAIGGVDPSIVKAIAGALTKDDVDEGYDDDYREPEAKTDITTIIADAVTSIAKKNPDLVDNVISTLVKKPGKPGDETDFTTQG